MHKVFDYFIYSWMVDSVLVIFTLSTLWSIIKNSNKAGYIPDDQYEILEGVISLKDIFSKFSKNKD